jgi:hypothetical protein
MKPYITGLIAITMASIQATAQIEKPVLTTADNKSVITRPTTIKTVPKQLQTITPVYDFSRVKTCMDPKPVSNNVPARNFSAVKAPPKINNDGTVSQVGVIRQPLAGETNKMWDPGQIINVFLSTANGSELFREKVRFYARQWEQHANIRFQFVTDRRSATIKVGFVDDKKFWSLVGKDALFNPFDNFTMNFGAFDANTSEDEFRSVILHEFGHALGFIHEHQSPVAGIPWDKEKVYAYYAEEPMKWTRSEVDFNLFQKYSRTTTNFSAYDPRSIMHYSIPAQLTSDGSSTPWNVNFSATDKSFVGAMYPFPPTGMTSTGNLRTNDDCDDVQFKVEYDVVAADKIEFNLQLGESGNKKVTWWKQIGIPRTNGTETNLWVQNHSLIQSENRKTISQQIPFAEINTGKGISFWKAKILGVHTLLPYKWNVLPALKGGCRVTLSWNRDTCL